MTNEGTVQLEIVMSVKYKPVEFKHRLQSHPAIIKLQLFFEKLVSWKIVIPKIVLKIGIRDFKSWN